MIDLKGKTVYIGSCPKCSQEKYMNIIRFYEATLVECDYCSFGASFTNGIIQPEEITKPAKTKKTITGQLNFLMQAYNINHFLRDMDKYNCDISLQFHTKNSNTCQTPKIISISSHTFS